MKLGAKSIEDMQSNSGTHFLGRFQNGQVVGHFWIGLINNGYIQGIADENGKATGDDIAFIYPDANSSLGSGRGFVIIVLKVPTKHTSQISTN